MSIGIQILYFLLSFSSVKTVEKSTITRIETEQSLHDECQLAGVISRDAFSKAMAGYEKFRPEKSIVTIVDFSLPSSIERFFVIDITN